MTAELNIDKFEDFIAQYPIFEYRILNTGDLSVEERVRIVLESTPEDTENAIRDGIFALIRPVITFTDGRCVAMIR